MSIQESVRTASPVLITRTVNIHAHTADTFPNSIIHDAEANAFPNSIILEARAHSSEMRSCDRIGYFTIDAS